MQRQIYIPPSCTTAEKHLEVALNRDLRTLTTSEFVRAWCSLAYLYPGLHPDGYASRGSGWPKALKPVATEAWRRATAGQLTDNQLYCYQASKARLLKDVGIMALEARKKPWYFTDHFAA
jgi:hypothetical protein